MSDENPAAAAAAVSTTSEQQSTTADTTAAAAAKTTTKTKAAIIFGYVGYGYYGLQHNFDPEHPTLEALLVDALHAVGYISDENMMGQFLKKINWERASRTDKGVSALRNVGSCKLVLPVDKTPEELVAPLNAILNPKRMHVFRIAPATSTFDAYNACTGRVYEYLLPTYCLLSGGRVAAAAASASAAAAEKKDNDDDADDAQQQQQQQESQLREELLNATRDDYNEQIEQQRRRPRDDLTLDVPEFISPALYKTLRAYRLPRKKLDLLRAFFALMEGTNSFHNFTPNATQDDPSANRFMRWIRVSDPFLIPVVDKSGGDDKGGDCVEWVRIQLNGQSFMLNQIRKMVGCVVEAIVRGHTDGGFVRGMFVKDPAGNRRVMPMAPANGLFLCSLELDKYNHRLARVQQSGVDAIGKEKIVIEEVPADDAMRVLVEKCVSEHEVKDQFCVRWLAGLLRTRADDFVIGPYNEEKAAADRAKAMERKKALEEKEQEKKEGGGDD